MEIAIVIAIAILLLTTWMWAYGGSCVEEPCPRASRDATRIPHEVMAHVFDHLRPRDLRAVALCSKRFSSIGALIRVRRAHALLRLRPALMRIRRGAQDARWHRDIVAFYGGDDYWNYWDVREWYELVLA